MRFPVDENVSRAVDQNSLTLLGNNFRLARDQVVLLAAEANLSVSRRQANDFYAYFFLFLSWEL